LSRRGLQEESTAEIGEQVGRETRPTAIGTVKLPNPCSLVRFSTESVGDLKNFAARPMIFNLAFRLALAHIRRLDWKLDFE
jgi:hypothetical protein